MAINFSKEQKKSFVLTTALFALLILCLFLIKFASENRINQLAGGGGGGVTVNFGDSEFGSGDNYNSEILNINDQNQQKIIATSPDDEILSQDSDEDVAVINTKVVKKTENKNITKEVTPEVKKPSKNATDALSNMFNSSNKGGDGDDNRSGNKGSLTGDKNSNSYYGDGGSGGGSGGGHGSGNGTGNGSGNGPGSGGGSGGGYSLGNRKPVSKPNPEYICNETGKVVVEVTVDKTGKTIEAIAGVRGSTNTAKCLVEQAKAAALNTRWQADASAPDKQVGKIIYTFNLN